MRYGVVIAGGSGTRLWPMSRAALPKQLIRFIDDKSLLQLAMQRLSPLVPIERRYICAGQSHQEAIISSLDDFDAACYLSEPTGRDTLNAVGFAAAVISRCDPDAVIAVLTADHIIEPKDEFTAVLEQGFELAERQPETLVTFGVTPTHPATGYGYLELGTITDGAYTVQQYKEKPDAQTAAEYVNAGAEKYLWNSGMFVWRAATLLDCIRRYEPTNHAGLMQIAQAWDTPHRDAVLNEIYPTLAKISVDYAVMEPASKDVSGAVRVGAVPMSLNWLDIGSWPAFAQICDTDQADNALGAARHLLMDSRDTLVASADKDHLIATIGCEGLIIIHSPDATLVCRADRAEDIRKLHDQIRETFGANWL